MIDEKKLIEDIEKEFDGVCVYDVSPSQAVADFVEIVDRQPKVGEWIPCSERLPEYDYDTVLCVTDTNFWSVMVYTKEHGFRSADMDFNGEVIAWMPLPAPYKEERGGKNE